MAAILTMVLVGNLASAATATAQEITPAKGPVALTGTAGVPLDRAEFWVYADPASEIMASLEIGDSASILTLPNEDVLTVDGKSFTVSVDPASLPADRIDRYGNVNIGVFVTVPGDKPLVGSTQATVTMADGRWVDPLAVQPDTGQVVTAAAEPVNVTVDLRLRPAQDKEQAILPTNNGVSAACQEWRVVDYRYVWTI